MPLKIVNHSKRAARIAQQFGWLPGALYTNLRDIREFKKIGLIDICWEKYDFQAHMSAVERTRPLLTVARDVINVDHLDRILLEAESLKRYAQAVIIVPKDPRLRPLLNSAIPSEFLLGYSVPTRYGASPIDPGFFQGPVHLLGGRPDVQRRLGEKMNVVSLDCNRFTLDAEFGDYFDGETFRPHPVGGYELCLTDSVRNIDRLWSGYDEV